VSSVAYVSSGYARSLRPCGAPPIEPSRGGVILRRVIRRRHPFLDLVERQLRLFGEANAGLLADCDRALRSYNAADGDEAEQRYGEFVDLVDTARDELEQLRDGYALTLEGPEASEYAELFGQLARKRFPAIALELD
jgi:hypothetical protein